jgi:hypothetical protein
MVLSAMYVFAVLTATLGLAGGPIYDVIALFTLLAVVFQGIVSVQDAVMEFSYPA